MNDQKKTGVWIDSKKAVIVSFLDGDKTVAVIESGIEGHERIEGETDQRVKFAGKTVDNERQKERRKEKDVHEYLREVIGRLSDSDSLAIFGPAGTKTKLMKELDAHPVLKGRVRTVQAVDSMTQNQIVALVKTYYNL